MMQVPNLVRYITEQNNQKREYSVYGEIPLIIKDFSPSEEVNYNLFVEEIENTVPKSLLGNVEMIYIGEFPFLEGRNAVYQDGAIYITNKEPTTYDLLEDFVHEVAHSIEGLPALLRSNEGIISEFLGKRQRLKSILEQEGHKIPERYYTNLDYSEDFDMFLSDVVGYPLLLTLTIGLFVSPYGATSLEEYFANSFENYYLDSIDAVRKISPQLYVFIDDLQNRKI